MRTLLGPAVVAVAFHAWLMSAHMARYGGDVAALVCVGSERVGHYPYEAIHYERTGTVFRAGGYDGQFYYAIARDPWSRHTEGIDCPSLRHVRVLYPVLCWLLTGGDPDSLVWAMPLVNLLAIGALAAFGAAVARRSGLSPWWGFLLPLAVNSPLSLLRDLTDTMSSLAVCGLLCAWLWEWPAWSVCLWACAAVFSREQNVATVVIVLAVALCRQRRGTAFAALLALLAFLAWALTLRWLYGTWPLLPPDGNFAPRFWGVPVPGWGLAFRWTHLELSRDGLIDVLATLALSLQILMVVYVVLRGADAVLVLVAVVSAALALIGGVWIYQDVWGYGRVFAPLPLALWLASAQARERWPLLLFASPHFLLRPARGLLSLLGRLAG